MTPEPSPPVPSGGRKTRRTLVAFGTLAVVAVALAAAVTLYFSSVEEERAENRYPVYWAEIEEGRTTERALRARLGPPDEVEGECLVYGDLVEAQEYEFCFEQGVLAQKAAI